MPTLTDRVQRLLDGPRPLPIVGAGHPVLRRRADDYDGSLDPDLWTALIAAMREAMLLAPGVGLAGPQVGLPIRLAVIEDRNPVDPAIAAARERRPVDFRVLVNPAYWPVGDRRVAFFEGCLSVPGFQAVTARAHEVRLICQDHTGQPVDEILSGWPARIVAHETDHLNGTLYLDHAELRSLTTNDAFLERWNEPEPLAAAAELGFRLPD